MIVHNSQIRKFQQIIFVILLFIFWVHTASAIQSDFTFIDQQISNHVGLSGVKVLEKGEEALLARAWLADHAQESIEVQYFIWSTDNIGILATEALLRAAKRGVKVRVIVDDLLIDAPDKSLLALSLHPNVEIRIYNPKHSVGTSFITRILNVVTDFRGVNQRMHDKTFIVDGKVAIVGGRNMADEYFDYDHKYNFRDRDALVVGEVVNDIRQSFDRFWMNELSVSPEECFAGMDILPSGASADDIEVQQIYNELHTYARLPENFEPKVRNAINEIPTNFQSWMNNIIWSDAKFISDKPGKNTNRFALDGGGLSTSALAKIFTQAKTKIIIQSPYLILSDEAEVLFREAVERGVKIHISTNSLASTDNLQAFSGYKNQRKELLDMGLHIYEYKPYPEIQIKLIERYPEIKFKQPVFALHAKTMIIDSRIVYIGTYNLDPRSENLNTEVGIIVDNERLAKSVEQTIAMDMATGNSWSAKDNPDQFASLGKRIKVFFWQFAPIKPLL